jgi:PAS domain S-box-containing protein
MSAPDDFYALLSSLLQQTAQNPEAPPVIPLKRWPAGSPEQFLLEDLQAALVALQTGNQNHPSQAKERERLYQSIFETASDGLIINDLETGLVVEANPAACTMYGYAGDEFIDLHPTRFIHPDSSHQFTKYVQAVQSQGVYVALQVHMRRDGSQFYIVALDALAVATNNFYGLRYAASRFTEFVEEA